MMIPVLRFALAIGLAVYVCGSADVRAQTRPYRSLFAGAATAGTPDHQLDVSLSLAQAYDGNVLADTGSGGPAAQQLEGLFTSLAGELRYAKRGRRAEFAVNLGTNLRYFAEFDEISAVGHTAGAGMSLTLGPLTTLTLNEAFAYTPSFFFGVFPGTQPDAIGDTVPAAADYLVSDRRSYTSLTDAVLRRQIGRRTSLDVIAAYRQTRFSGGADSGLGDLTSYEGGARLGHTVARDVTLRVGYVYRQAEYGRGQKPVTHDIGLGVDYNRPLSRSRRTRLGITFGSSLLDAPAPGQALGEGVQQLHATANVLLTHQMGRTWSARAAYRRGAQFIEELSAPLLSDGVTLSADGFVNRRTDFSSSLSYSAGNLVGLVDSAFEMYTGTARLRVGLTRQLAAYAEYVYYFYDFERGAQLPAGTPMQIERNGVRVGLTLWMPLIRN